MDWRTINFDWNRARAFLVTAEEGSLSAAARALGMAQPTLGRQVDALEAELGVTLFERLGRRLVLTETGLDLLDHVRAMGAAANKISLTATGHSDSIEGTVTISASEAYAAFRLPPLLKRLRALAPGIRFEIVATLAASDLQRREADIAIRNFRPTQPDLVARKIGDDLGHFYATPAYLATVGDALERTGCPGVDMITFGSAEEMIEFMRPLGLDLSQARFPFGVPNHLVQWEMVKQGLGVGVMAESVGANEPAVVRALSEMAPIPFPVWLTVHREVRTSRRVRLVFDFLAEALAEKA